MQVFLFVKFRSSHRVRVTLNRSSLVFTIARETEKKRKNMDLKVKNTFDHDFMDFFDSFFFIFANFLW